MKQPQVGIIVPVYNTEKYLLKCYNSIVNSAQNLDFEIIFVNDGSTDDSLSLLNEFAKNDDRIKVISQANQGLSAARNTGIDASSSKFILFLDSDDCISLKYMSNLYDLACDNKLDIISYGGVHQLHSLEQNLEDANWTISTAVTIENGKDNLRKNFILTSACQYLYKLSFLKENGITFTKGIVLEDIEFCMRLMLSVNRMAFTDIPVYYYYIGRPGSITYSTLIEKKEKRVSDSIKVAKLVMNNKSPNFDNALNASIERAVNSILFDVIWRFFKNKKEFSRSFKIKSIELMESLELFPIKGATRGRMQKIAKLLSHFKLLFKRIVC